MTKLFQGGIPTGIDVNRLMAEITPQSGSSVSYDEVSRITGIARDANRFRSVTNVWRKRLFREKGLQTACDGEAFHFLTADQAFDASIKQLSVIGRASGRLRVRVGMISVDALSDERRGKFDILLREIDGVTATARQAVKQVAGPRPVQAAPRISLMKA